MKTENKNIKQDPKYTVIYTSYIDRYTYMFIAIYKYKKDVYRFIYQNNKQGRKSGIYKLSDIGWIQIEDGEVIKRYGKLDQQNYTIHRLKDERNTIIVMYTDFFNTCQKYLDFLLS